jgi:TatA/E family protein of Tat protein translocase
MFELDPTKILIILAIALLVIDPKRLPQVSRRAGRTIREFRLAVHTMTREVGAGELVEDLRGLNQARGTFGQTIRRGLGLDELAQSMNLDENREWRAAPATEQPSADAPVVRDAVTADSAMTSSVEAPLVDAPATSRPGQNAKSAAG